MSGFELVTENFFDDRFYWYRGSIASLTEDIADFNRREYSKEQIIEYLQERKFSEYTCFPEIISIDDKYIIVDGKTDGAVYLGYFESTYMLAYSWVILFSYLVFIAMINIIFKKIEDSFKYVTQTAEDSNLLSDHQKTEKKLLGYIQSFFDPIELVSKSFLPKYTQNAFKDNHKKSVKGFTDLINKYVEAKQQELLGQVKVRNETRNKIAADLHDDIGTTLTKISHNSEIIRSSNDIPRIKNASEKISRLSHEMLLSFSDVIWAIDSRKDTMTELVDHMYDLTFDLLPDRQINVSFESEEFGEQELDVEVRQKCISHF